MFARRSAAPNGRSVACHSSRSSISAPRWAKTRSPDVGDAVIKETCSQARYNWALFVLSALLGEELLRAQPG